MPVCLRHLQIIFLSQQLLKRKEGISEVGRLVSEGMPNCHGIVSKHIDQMFPQNNQY